MDTNVLATEQVAVLGVIEPQATITTTQYSNVIDLSKFIQALGIAFIGAINASDQVVFSAYACDSAGANASAFKTVTFAPTTATTYGNQNTQIKIGVRADDLTNQTYQYMKFGLKCGTTGGPAAIVVLGIDPKYGPASDWDLASVTVNNTNILTGLGF
jgi:hypothetical protein